MDPIQRHLPPECYGHDRELVVQGAIIHYLSAIHAWKIFPELEPDQYDPFDEALCRRVLEHYRFSANLFVARNGDLYEWVPLDRVAWHAGHSILNGRSDCNDFCVGIEIASTGQPWHGEPAFTDASLLTAQQVCAELMSTYGFGLDWIDGHDAVRSRAIEAGQTRKKKYDPGPNFPWDRFRAPLKHVVPA